MSDPLNGQRWQVLSGNCLGLMRSLPDGSVDAVVTDPPYGLSFMGKKWDYDVPSVDIWAEALRVLRPGGHCLAFAGTRTQHRMAVRIEDAGFEIRDMLAWCYGSGFPKSHNLKGDWEGWGTALKPALEPITVARKPFKGAVAQNVLAHGTGALNIDGCRVQSPDAEEGRQRHGGGVAFAEGASGFNQQAKGESPAGRWPANLLHDGSDEVVRLFPQSDRNRNEKPCTSDGMQSGYSGGLNGERGPRGFDDSRSAARFFYCAKADRAERNEGLGGGSTPAVRENATMREREIADWSTRNGNHHPTVKPVDLMRWLCRLVTPSGGIVLDPFCGSGSTGVACAREGMRFLGMELSEDYATIARRRIADAYAQGKFDFFQENNYDCKS